jgi:hypothetical protein
MGSSRPVCFFSAALSRRRNVGTAAQSDCSTMCSPPRASAPRHAPVSTHVHSCSPDRKLLCALPDTSSELRILRRWLPSTGVGLCLLSSSVCHNDVISRTMSAMVFSFSSCVVSGLQNERRRACQAVGHLCSCTHRVSPGNGSFSPVILCKQGGNASMLVLKSPPVHLRGMRRQHNLCPLW